MKKYEKKREEKEEPKSSDSESTLDYEDPAKEDKELADKLEINKTKAKEEEKRVGLRENNEKN